MAPEETKNGGSRSGIVIRQLAKQQNKGLMTPLNVGATDMSAARQGKGQGHQENSTDWKNIMLQGTAPPSAADFRR